MHLRLLLPLLLLALGGAQELRAAVEQEAFDEQADGTDGGEKPFFEEADEPTVEPRFFYGTQELVDAVNGDPEMKWTAGFNSYFDGRLEEDAAGLMGAQLWEPITAERRAELTWAASAKDEVEIPETFDARLEWPQCKSIKEIRDQSACGSCWAFGAVEAMSDRICVASKGVDQTRLSAEQLLSCCDGCGMGCQGGDAFEAWNYWMTEGIVTGGNYTARGGCQPYALPPCEHHRPEGQFRKCPTELFETPFCERRCQATYAVPFSKDRHYGASAYAVEADVAAIQKEIFAHGPVEATFSVYADLAHYKEGVYSHAEGSGAFLGGHAVRVLGWGTEAGTPFWLLANSWNADWGLQDLLKNPVEGFSAGLADDEKLFK